MHHKSHPNSKEKNFHHIFSQGHSYLFIIYVINVKACTNLTISFSMSVLISQTKIVTAIYTFVCFM